MSQENVEIVRRFLSADVDEALPYADLDIVWNPIEELPRRDTMRFGRACRIGKPTGTTTS